MAKLGDKSSVLQPSTRVTESPVIDMTSAWLPKFVSPVHGIATGMAGLLNAQSHAMRPKAMLLLNGQMRTGHRSMCRLLSHSLGWKFA